MAQRTRRAAAPHFKTPVPNLFGSPMPPGVSGAQVIGREPSPPWIAVARIKAIHYQYLECELWDPWVHGYVKSTSVAMPWLLRAVEQDYEPIEDGDAEKLSRIHFPDFDERVEHESHQKRHAFYYDPGSEFGDGSDEDARDVQCNQRITPPYMAGDLLLVARLESAIGAVVTSPRADGDVLLTPAEETAPDHYPMKRIKDSDGKFIHWMDMNVAGRRWEAPPMRRAYLTENLYSCDTAEAKLINECETSACDCEDAGKITVTDSIGAVSNQVIAQIDDNGDSYLPADTQIYVWPPELHGTEWWFVQAGELCQESSVSSVSSVVSSAPSSSAPSSVSSVSSIASEECIQCFNDVCAEDIPTIGTVDDGYEVLVRDKATNCMYWAPVFDCADDNSEVSS